MDCNTFSLAVHDLIRKLQERVVLLEDTAAATTAEMNDRFNRQDKRIEDLERQVSDLKDVLDAMTATAAATRDGLERMRDHIEAGLQNFSNAFTELENVA